MNWRLRFLTDETSWYCWQFCTGAWVFLPDISSWPSAVSYLRLWPSARSMPLYTLNVIWTEWCNNRNMWFLMDMRLWSRKTKQARWHEWPQKDRAREKKEKEQYLVSVVLESQYQRKPHTAPLFSHCRKLPPPLSLFYWIKFPTSSLFTLVPIFSSSFFFSSPYFLAFLLSITHFARWHFQWETQILLKHSSCAESNSFCDEPRFKGRHFFPVLNSPFLLSLLGLCEWWE